MITDIKIIYTRHGNILGEIVSSDSNGLTVKNPMLLVPQGMVDMLEIVDENTIKIETEEILFGVFTPIKEILNIYNQRFGSGIQLLS